MNRVTVAICTRNRARYLKESLQSVIEQTYKDMDIVIYDNASEDNTEEVARSFTDPRVTYVKNDRNIGGFANINKALSSCKTEFIAVFHDDDIMLPHMIETEVAAMDRYPDAAVCGQAFSHIIINACGEVTAARAGAGKDIAVWRKGQYIQKSVCEHKGCLLCCPSVMFRNSYVKKFNLRFDEKAGTAADWLMWLHINTLDCAMIGIPEALLKYREHGLNWHVDASKNSAFADSYYYIYKFLRDNNIAADLTNFKNDVIPPSLSKYGHMFLQNPSALAETVRELKENIRKLERDYDITLSNYYGILLNILSPVVTAIGENKAPVAHYYRLKRILKKELNASPTFIREIKWALKYFIYLRHIKRRI